MAIHAGPSDAARVGLYARGLLALPGSVAVTPPRYLGAGLWQVGLALRYPALDSHSLALVKTVRARGAPFPVSVTGQSANFVDQQSSGAVTDGAAGSAHLVGAGTARATARSARTAPLGFLRLAPIPSLR